jgi:GTPase SAR1 family protein/rubrerythrin
MAELLNVVSSYALTNVSPNEVGALIDQMIEKSKDNAEEISELTLECTSLLTSAQNKSNALSSQGIFKRLIGEVTGRNTKLQNAIINDNTNALYAAQTVINKVMLECTNNRTLLMAVNDRVSDLYLELKEDQIGVQAQVAMVRKGFVAFYQEFLKENEKQLRKIDKLESYQNSMCPKCGYDLISWQRMCPNCGYIHPMKTEKSSKETKEILSKLSKVLTDDTSSSDIMWDITAMKTDAVIRKVKLLAELGKLPAYPRDLVQDMNILMKKCRSAEFQIAVVGVMKAGKSFLMNALIGAEIASVEVNPETAALTKFRSSDGYYVKVSFHDNKQWTELKASVLQSENTINISEKQDSFAARLRSPHLKEMEKKYIGKESRIEKCKDLDELREQVRIYTSSKSLAHILVSEIEVGIDKSVFNMPTEVVFVDTPGLKDPVQYRSDITEKYIKRANAVLVALKPGPLTAEGVEIVTTVLDKTDKEKTIIVGTQSDLNSETERAKYVSNWKELLIEARKYKNERDINSRIVLTSAKMELLIKKWNSLSAVQRNDEKYFSDDDYNALEKYARDTFKTRRFDIGNISQEESNTISNATGIPSLRRKLENTLIANYRKLLVDDIVKTFERCRVQLAEFSNRTISNQEDRIVKARMDTDMLKAEIAKAERNRTDIDKQTTALKQEAERIINSIRSKIDMAEMMEV